MNNQLADIHDMLIDFMNEEEAGKILIAIENKITDAEGKAYSTGYDEGYANAEEAM